ncbi:MAG: polyphosphate polymerase domain-containing protein [Methanocalculus sp.]|uniref:polyphosphate polymerase domain-containing protein n=1 Tax=Methanocalculus sp. TaxID=2004547 RepID=UPI00271EB744|nr:polyphosphate polymerase domain-containing protein [Methanocalculus sp.]MDO9538513.1 polyphosphate polymerase domain-containing protein [Methanocalculus sp.]
MSTMLSGFDPITLDELNGSEAQLLDRTETKFLMTTDQCRMLISYLRGSYRLLTIDDSWMGRYETEYYDTQAFLMYLQHHNGKANRFKLRFRRYLSSGMTFFEVKEKTNTGRTIKKRLETDGQVQFSEPDLQEFLHASFPYEACEFHPVLMTVYDRITLVSRDYRERITFDLNLTFRNDEETRSYPDVVIGEIKHDRASRQSPAIESLQTAGLREASFSKYCIGVSLLYGGVKHNRFKRKLLFLEKLSSVGGATVC